MKTTKTHLAGEFPFQIDFEIHKMSYMAFGNKVFLTMLCAPELIQNYFLKLFYINVFGLFFIGANIEKPFRAAENLPQKCFWVIPELLRMNVLG